MTRGALKEQKWRLVTNLIKLRPSSSMTQMDLALWLTVMLSLPRGSSEDHEERAAPGDCGRANHPPFDTVGWRDEGTTIQKSLQLDWCHSLWVSWLNILPEAACGNLTYSMWRGQTDPQQAASNPGSGLQTMTSQLNLLCCKFFFFSISLKGDVSVYQ